MANFILRFETFLQSLDPKIPETRVHVVEMCREVVAECRSCLQSRHLPTFVDVSRCLRLTRNVLLELALEATSQKTIMSTSANDIIAGKPWDESFLSGFLCACFLTAVAADAWHATLDASTFEPFTSRLDAEIRSGLRWKKPKEVIESMESAGISPIDVVLPAFAVAFEAPEESSQETPYANARRLTREGVRLLERAQLFDVAREGVEQHLAELTHETPATIPAQPTSEEVCIWFKRCVDTEANNALLLRLDEWALLCQLRPLHAAMATGERGGTCDVTMPKVSIRFMIR